MNPAREGERAGFPNMGSLVRATSKEQALYMLERLIPGTAANHLSAVLRVNGRLDLAVLQESLDMVLRRHEVLRTVYYAAGPDLYKMVAEWSRFHVKIESLHISDEMPSEIEEDLNEIISRRFHLDGRPLVRVGLMRYRSHDVLCVVVHHLIFDTLSGIILLKEIIEYYNMMSGDMAHQVIPRDVATPIEEPKATDQAVDYWRQRLADFDPSEQDLRIGAGAHDGPVTLRGEHITLTLSREATLAIRRLKTEFRVPEAVLLLAGYYILLATHEAGPDIVIGSPFNCRPLRESQAIGYYVNVLPLRVKVDESKSFRDLVRDVTTVFFEALSHRAVPVDSIPGMLPRAGMSWNGAVFQYLFNYLPGMDLAPLSIGNLDAVPVVVENGCSKFNLEFFVMSSEEEISIRTVYRKDIYSYDDVRLLLGRYDALLASLAADEDDIPIAEISVWSAEDHLVIDAANNNAVPVHPLSVLDAFSIHAKQRPSSVAVINGDRRVTYGQLWNAAMTLRDELKSAQVAPGQVVSVIAPRSPELLISVLAVWLTGASYLPIDRSHPSERKRFQIQDSGACAIVTFGETECDVPANVRLIRLEDALRNVQDHGAEDAQLTLNYEDAAYLLYTSGSTGQPKGTLISHRALNNAIAHCVAELEASPATAAVWMTSFSFDMSGTEVFVPIYCGGRVIVAPDEARTNGKVLSEIVSRHNATIIVATPTTFRIVEPEFADVCRGLHVMSGGEMLPAPLASHLMQAGCKLHNAYGVTEAAIWSTSGLIDRDVNDDTRISIGRPISNTEIRIMNSRGRVLPIGVCGELCIFGSGVGLGYHNRPELTSERFCEDARYGTYYRTGDMAIWRGDGTLELKGRADRQVKLRGNRIELGEIEAVLSAHPMANNVAVVVTRDHNADDVITAFVETSEVADIRQSLWEFAAARLPRAALPSNFVTLDLLPRNRSEKIDYLSLGRLASERATGYSGRDQNDDGELAISLASLWCTILQRGDVHANTNFFTHGGHSLLAAKLVQDIGDMFGVEIPLADVFEYPTPASMAEHIAARNALPGRL